MSAAYVNFVRFRLLATGHELTLDEPSLTTPCTTEAELDHRITEIYKFLYEGLSADVAHLGRTHPMPEVSSTLRLIYNLRTSSQHSDNAQARQLAARWRKQFATPQLAGEALASSLGLCLRQLSEVAGRVRRDSKQMELWRQTAIVDLEVIFSTAAADLGLTFSPGNSKRMIRQVENRLKIDRNSGSLGYLRLAAEFCVQEMIADHVPLPVPYTDVLDALGLLGARGASGAITLAHSVAEIAPDLKPEDFLARVEHAWRAAAAY